MATPSITIKKGFQHATQFFGPGSEAALLALEPKPTSEQLAAWQKRGLIEAEGVEAPAEKTSETAVLQLLKPYVGETGETEDEVETLVRIIRERDEAEDELENAGTSPLEKQLVTVLDGQAGGGVADTGPVDRLNRIIAERDEARQNAATSIETITQAQRQKERLELAVSTISGSAPFERSSDETPLETLERYADSLRDKQVTSPPAGEQLSEVVTTQTPVTAEELTKVIGSPRAAIAILEAKFDTREKLAAASDKDLEALPDLAEGRIKKLRDWLAG